MFPPHLVQLPKFKEKSDFAEIIGGRHIGWLPKIEGLFDKGGVFVAVGNNHLNSANGLLSLLEKRGYSVEFIGAPDCLSDFAPKNLQNN